MSFPCYCASTECRVYGCRVARSYMSKEWQDLVNRALGDQRKGITIPARGCICPPTSEQTCQSPMCPRKAVR